MISKEREADLDDLFWAESNDPDTQEWRDELTGEEVALVDKWDRQYRSAEIAMCERILTLRSEANQLEQFRREYQTRKGSPERLASLMTDMEHQYGIPLLRLRYEPWAAQHPEIATLYKQISDARWEAKP